MCWVFMVLIPVLPACDRARPATAQGPHAKSAERSLPALPARIRVQRQKPQRSFPNVAGCLASVLLNGGHDVTSCPCFCQPCPEAKATQGSWVLARSPLLR